MYNVYFFFHCFIVSSLFLPSMLCPFSSLLFSLFSLLYLLNKIKLKTYKTYKSFSKNSIFPLSFSSFPSRPDEDSLSVRLPILKVSHPSATSEVDDPLSLSLVIPEIAFIFLPVIFLHSHKCLIGFIFGVSYSYYIRLAVILCPSPMELALLELPLITNLFLIPK